MRAQSIPEVFGTIIRTVLGLIGAIALLMFIYGGIIWITAGGNDKKVTEAKEILKNAMLGIVIIFFAYTVIGAFLSAILTQ